ncbi:MAG: hypothetical protein JW807_14800 [Spirochaetes bacterium]|nr:hypothetical protein [Spirochaetota bacterium]
MEHIKGNTFNRTFGPFKDENGNLVQNFNLAENIIFVIKKEKTDSDTEALIKAEFGDGITLNAPAATINVQKDSDSMDNLEPGTYFIAIQVEYSENNRIELELTENGKKTNRINIKQDIIRGGLSQ